LYFSAIEHNCACQATSDHASTEVDRPNNEGAHHRLPSLPERMRFDAEGLDVVIHPDGRKSVNLQGRYMHMAAITHDSEGNRIIGCYSDHEHLHQSSPIQPAEEVVRHVHVR
jgi:hypothetical protein